MVRIKMVVIAAVAAMASLCVVALPRADAQEAGRQTGLSVQGGRLLDARGNDVILRGINHPHAWFPDQMGVLSDIKRTGANAVRVVMSTGDRYRQTTAEEVAAIVSECQMHRLICVLELHDTTGYPTTQGSITLAQATEFWIGLAPLLQGHEAHVIVNIGNEPFDNSAYLDWTTATTSAIRALRSAGFDHALMVDAPNWGQDWSFTMRDNAANVLRSDPHRNVIFDVHMYGVFDTEVKVRSYLESFAQREVPLVIGEFAAFHSDGDPAEEAIFKWAQSYGIGYFGWSWSGNIARVDYLNLVRDFDPSQLSSWGVRLIEAGAGLRQTSVEAPSFWQTTSLPPSIRRQPLSPVTVDPLVRHGRFEAEAGVRNGVRAALKGAGFSGAGYVDGFDAAGDSVTVTVHVDTAGSYDLAFGYRARYGDKTQHLHINGVHAGSLHFGASTSFTTMTLPRVHLESGANAVTIAHDWGWFDLDFVEVWGSGILEP